MPLWNNMWMCKWLLSILGDLFLEENSALLLSAFPLEILLCFHPEVNNQEFSNENLWKLDLFKKSLQWYIFYILYSINTFFLRALLSLKVVLASEPLASTAKYKYIHTYIYVYIILFNIKQCMCIQYICSEL